MKKISLWNPKIGLSFYTFNFLNAYLMKNSNRYNQKISWIHGLFLLGLSLLQVMHAQEVGLVGYWNFDEGMGYAVHDASGNGHDGRIKNAKWVLGKVKQALSFENGGFVEIPDHQELRLQKDFTITAWIMKTQVSKAGKSMGIVSKSSQDAWDYDLFMSTSRQEHPAFYSDAFKAQGGDIEVISTVPITLNEWHHIAVIRNGQEAKIYIDGIITGTASLPEELSASSKNLFIGNDHDGGFEGSIDEVRIYSRALTEQEIRVVMNEIDNCGLLFKHTIVDPSFGGIRVVADIDGDKYPDIVHAFWYNSAPLAWYEYRNDGTWNWNIIRENFYPVTDNFDITDMDGDGDPDIIMAKSGAKRSDDPEADGVQIEEVEIVWFENPRPQHNPRTFSWKEHVVGGHVDSNENYVKDIKAADFTGEGKPEIVIRSNVAVSVFHQDKPGSWKQIRYIGIRPHEGMDTGDLDCDGDPDIALNGYWLECPDDPVNGTWKEHNIERKWWNQTGDWTANNCKVFVTDMNGDGCSDVLLSHSERAGYPVTWYEAVRSDRDHWKEHVIDSVDFCHTLQAADMDLDGDMDVVTGEMEKSDDPDQIIIFQNEGDALRWKKQLVTNTGIYSGKVEDMDNDGDPDIVSNRNFDRPPLEIWENLIRKF